jgi:hypothetical protein
MRVFTSAILTLLILLAIGFISIANAQTNSSASEQQEVATVANPSSRNSAAAVPVFKDYRGIRIGMTADEVRSTLDGLKKDKGQDVLVFSEHESAQIFYDQQGKVTAISIDYFGDNNNAPSPAAVLGTELQPKADGSMYQLNRYPDAGYWVSYNRTAGDKPIVTITMQKM